MAELSQRRPLVSICIPAFRSRKFISGVLDHALAQTVDDIEIVVSNDGGFETPELDHYRANPRVSVCDQDRRLGWVNNTNAALELAQGAYFMVLPHDDQILPTYVEECLAVLEDDSSAFAAYSDLQIPGRVLVSSEVRGNLRERVRHVMRHLYNGYSYRALMRRDPANWPLLKMRPNRPTNFCVDSTWILQQALFGELRRIPKPLYLKSFHADTTHSKWESIAPDVLRTAWRQHCETMGALALRRVRDAAFVERLVQHRMNPGRVREAPPYLVRAFVTDQPPGEAPAPGR